MAHGGFQVLDILDDRVPIAEGLGHSGPLVGVAVSSDGRRVVAIDRRRQMQERDLPDRCRLMALAGRVYHPRINEGSDPNIALSPDGTLVAFVEGTFLTVEEVATGRVAARIVVGQKPAYVGTGHLAFDPTGHRIALLEDSSFRESSLRFWELPSGRRLAAVGREVLGPLPEHSTPMTPRKLVFGPDGTWCALAVVGPLAVPSGQQPARERHFVLVLDVATGRPLRRLAPPVPPFFSLAATSTSPATGGGWPGASRPAERGVTRTSRSRLGRHDGSVGTGPSARRCGVDIGHQFQPRRPVARGCGHPDINNPLSKLVVTWDLERPSEPVRVPWESRAA